ncbi:MAG: zinc ABC transporter substrate-binding protein [Candidatus Sumerlaeota bacterium]|nr:zinc ABC transporter substrate-binding protein [Candidatus Sumerlaeota bacterium]
MRRSVLLSLAGLALTIAGAASFAADAPEAKVRVFVSIPPQAFFVDRVGGGRVDVSVFVKPGQSHETYEPTPKQLAELSKAQLYFRVGAPFEIGLAPKIRSGYPHLPVVDTTQGIRLRKMTEDEALRADADSAAGGDDPHTWLDPMLVKIQAKNIAEALEQADPSHAADYEKNRASFQADLDAVNAKIAAKLAPFKGRAFFVFHPAFGYFADRYGLKQEAIEVAGREPTAKELVAIIDKARDQKIRVIFTQPAFAQMTANAVAQALGARIETLDPVAPDYLKNLETMADLVAQSFK